MDFGWLWYVIIGSFFVKKKKKGTTLVSDVGNGDSYECGSRGHMGNPYVFLSILL